MKSVWIPGLGLATILLILVAGIVVFTDSVYPFSQSLVPDEIVVDEHEEWSQMLASFGEEDDVYLAIDARVREIDDNLHQVRWEFSPGDNTRLESIQLGFDFGEWNPPVAFQEPGGSPWEPITFQRVSDSMGERTVFEVPDLGFQGSGTVVLEFLLGPHDEENQRPEEFGVEVDASLSRHSAVQLTDYGLSAWLNLQVPGES